jgi:hypothetical protein
MRIKEAFEQRKFKEGEVKFSKSTFQDPFVIKVLDVLAGIRQVPVSQIIEEINAEIVKFNKIKDLCPTLHGTIADNIIESELFKQYWKLETPPLQGAPKFSKVTFFSLVNAIRGEHNRFLPLRNFVEKRRHANPAYKFTQDPTDPNGDDPMYKGVDTACATLTGEFVFSIKFCQKLIDWAHLKGIKPKGKKYASNGGVKVNGRVIPIPDEYAYLEFLIMHEYLHYSEGDFYYQKIIPDANMKIINYVGDFRSNYLLVKSGYEQLPIGLFNDKINYDRQKEYIEMYNLIKDEMDKLPKQDGGGGGEGDGKDIPIEVGQEVRMPNGKKGKVVAVNADGTADVEEYE